MTIEKVITREQARELKPYLKYMDFGDLRKDRHFLAERSMYQNMMLGNIKTSLIDDLRVGFIKAHPDAEIPKILRKVD